MLQPMLCEFLLTPSRQLQIGHLGLGDLQIPNRRHTHTVDWDIPNYAASSATPAPASGLSTNQAYELVASLYLIIALSSVLDLVARFRTYETGLIALGLLAAGLVLLWTVKFLSRGPPGSFRPISSPRSTSSSRQSPLLLRLGWLVLLIISSWCLASRTLSLIPSHRWQRGRSIALEQGFASLILGSNDYRRRVEGAGSGRFPDLGVESGFRGRGWRWSRRHLQFLSFQGQVA